MALVVAAELEPHAHLPMVGAEVEDPPHWESLELGDTSVRVPCWLVVVLPAGTVAPVPLVLQVTSPTTRRACASPPTPAPRMPLTGQRRMRQLHAELAHLGQAVVVMEDIDLIVGDRARGGSGALLEFLVALDGAISQHEGVVTLATTNDVHSIDVAARRAARFDVVVEVGPPDLGARRASLSRYLRDVCHHLALTAVARVAERHDRCRAAGARERRRPAQHHEGREASDRYLGRAIVDAFRTLRVSASIKPRCGHVPSVGPSATARSSRHRARATPRRRSGRSRSPGRSPRPRSWCRASGISPMSS